MTKDHKDDEEIKKVVIEWKDGTKEIFEGVAAKLCGMYTWSNDCVLNIMCRRSAKPIKVIKRRSTKK
jgi:hypothetical protein